MGLWCVQCLVTYHVTLLASEHNSVSNYMNLTIQHYINGISRTQGW